MENSNQSAFESKKEARKNYTSLYEWVVKMKTAFTNAMLPSIFPSLVTVGYTEERLMELQQKVVVLEGLIIDYQRALANKIAETNQSGLDQKAINTVYCKHRSMAKLFFADDALACSVLKLNVAKNKDYSNWFQDVSNFYAQLVLNPGLAVEAEKVAITKAAVEDQRQQLDQLQTQKNKQQMRVAEVKQTLDQRNKAFDQLYPLYSEYIQYARILLPHDQALEAIGIKV